MLASSSAILVSKSIDDESCSCYAAIYMLTWTRTRFSLLRYCFCCTNVVSSDATLMMIATTKFLIPSPDLEIVYLKFLNQYLLSDLSVGFSSVSVLASPVFAAQYAKVMISEK